MSIGPRVDKLDMDPEAISRALNAALEEVRDAELLADLAQVSRVSALIKVGRRPADYFEVRDLRQVRKNLVLHTRDEVSIFFVAAEIFEWQDSDAFFRDAVSGRARLRFGSGAPED